MSKNCIRCAVNLRVGISLYCAHCRPTAGGCECVGEKAILEVYGDDRGEGILVVDGERVSGRQRTVKERCGACGKTSLNTMTFPGEN